MTVPATVLFEDPLRLMDTIDKVESRCIELMQVLGVVTNVGNIMVSDMEKHGIYKEGGFLIMDGGPQEDIYRNSSMAVEQLWSSFKLFTEVAVLCRDMKKEEQLASSNNGTDSGSEGDSTELGDSGKQSETTGDIG